MRTLFIILRSAFYLAMLLILISTGRQDSVARWLVSIVVVAWNSWDQLKKPNESVFHMRLGVLLETALIVLWSVMLNEGAILFLLLSPLMRTSIHLSIKEGIALIIVDTMTIAVLDLKVFNQNLPLQLLIGSLIGIGLYSLVLGLLLKQREQARRHVTVTSFEREQYSLDQERMRIAGQLHDVMGQHWASIVRALDVALVTEGEQSMSFVNRARETALQGLQEMRSAVHNWQDGRQTPHQWIDTLSDSVARFRDITAIHVVLEVQNIEWNRFDNAMSIAELLVRSSLEAMTNAVRHGEANIIRVQILNKEQFVKLIVKDDGKGVDPQSEPLGSGISSMKQRISLCKGQLKLRSAPGEGTTLEITLPYNSQGVD